MAPLMADEKLSGTPEDPSPYTIMEGVLGDLEPVREDIGINSLKPVRRRRARITLWPRMSPKRETKKRINLNIQGLMKNLKKYRSLLLVLT